MTADASLLAALQHGDSFFPSGAMAFSWGLEALRADGQVTSASDVQRFLEGQLHHRWACFDRSFLLAAHAAAEAPDRILDIDRAMEVQILPREQREGSRRCGAALLSVHERLGTAGAAAYRALVRDGKAPGHLAVMQGLLWSGVGIGRNDAVAISAHGLCMGIVSAAIRLSIISHVDSQRIVGDLRPLILRLVAEPAPALNGVGVYAPATDIAAMRHETQAVRLFAN